MKVLILGAGVVGVSSAWYRVRAGHEVTVVDRQAGAGLCCNRGVTFRYGATVRTLLAEGDRISGALVSTSVTDEVLSAGASGFAACSRQ